jgi:hypothetical protein
MSPEIALAGLTFSTANGGIVRGYASTFLRSGD